MPPSCSTPLYRPLLPRSTLTFGLILYAGLMSARRVVFAFLVVLSGAVSSALGRVSAASSTNLLLSVDRTEPYVAIDPAHPSTIVVATNTNYDLPVGGRYPVGYFTSHDGGKTFRQGA